MYWNQWTIPSPSQGVPISSNKYLLVVEAETTTTNYTSRVYIQISEVRLIGYIEEPVTFELHVNDITSANSNGPIYLELYDI